MAEITLEPRPALGTDIAIAGNRITERNDLAIVSVAVPLDGEPALKKALESAFGLAFPRPTASTEAGEMRAIRSAPDQLMLLFRHATPDAEPLVQRKLGGKGYTTDLTDVWVALEISGPNTAAALERVCLLDTAEMPRGAAARTVVEHMGAMIVRLDADGFLLLAARSSARSFLHAIETSYRNVTD